jgi:hypothetical protein
MELYPLSTEDGFLLPNLAHQSCFYFIAGTKHTSMTLKPDEAYKAGIVASLQQRQSEGWGISSHYVNYIKSL